MRLRTWILGAVCGIAWWAISLLLGARAYGILGAHPWVGPASGACAGVGLMALSSPIYRLASSRALLWYSPLSVYLAIALYGAVVFAIRWPLGDFPPGATPWAVGVQSIVGMWWGVTFLAAVAVPTQLAAYASHRVLRGVVRGDAVADERRARRGG